jgi:hypothetical protein
MICVVLLALLIMSSACGGVPRAVQDNCLQGTSGGCAVASGLQEFMLWWLPVGSINVPAPADAESLGEGAMGSMEAMGAFVLYSPLHGSKHGKVCVLIHTAKTGHGLCVLVCVLIHTAKTGHGLCVLASKRAAP